MFFSTKKFLPPPKPNPGYGPGTEDKSKSKTDFEFGFLANDYHYFDTNPTF